MSERTTGFILAGVTVLAWMIFWNGLVRAHAATHPDSVNDDAFVTLIG